MQPTFQIPVLKEGPKLAFFQVQFQDMRCPVGMPYNFFCPHLIHVNFPNFPRRDAAVALRDPTGGRLLPRVLVSRRIVQEHHLRQNRHRQELGDGQGEKRTREFI